MTRYADPTTARRARKAAADADRKDAADLVRHLLALRAEIEHIVATDNPHLSAEAREHLVQAATTIVASWYNSGKE